VWRSSVPRHPWIQPVNSMHPGGGARTHSNHFGRWHLFKVQSLVRADADPEVLPSLDGPATFFHPSRGGEPPVNGLLPRRRTKPYQKDCEEKNAPEVGAETGSSSAGWGLFSNRKTQKTKASCPPKAPRRPCYHSARQGCLSANGGLAEGRGFQSYLPRVLCGLRNKAGS
jgi:hypothetical protein